MVIEVPYLLIPIAFFGGGEFCAGFKWPFPLKILLSIGWINNMTLVFPPSLPPFLQALCAQAGVLCRERGVELGKLSVWHNIKKYQISPHSVLTCPTQPWGPHDSSGLRQQGGAEAQYGGGAGRAQRHWGEDIQVSLVCTERLGSITLRRRPTYRFSRYRWCRMGSTTFKRRPAVKFSRYRWHFFLLH